MIKLTKDSLDNKIYQMSKIRKIFASFFKLIFTALAIEPADLRKPSVISLILANLWPIFGVLFLDWEIYPIIVLFMMENFIIAIFTIMKIASLPVGKPIKWLQKIILIPYFCLSYGFFMLGQGLAVFIIFSGYFQYSRDFPSISLIYQSLEQYQILWALLALAISHGISFIINYVNKKEYRKNTLDTLIWEPYERVGIMVVVIFTGGFIAKELGSIIALIVLILIKIYMDIIAHLKHHAKVAER